MPLKVPEARLEGKLRDLYERHLSQTRKVDWSYHSLLPWERGRNYTSQPWQPQDAPLTPALYTAIETALLTEVNLPWFTTYLTSHVRGGYSVLQDFIYTWTAEESQHANLLEIYLLLSRCSDPELMHQMRKEVLLRGPFEPDLDSAFEVMVYTSIQELATRAFYLNVAQLGDREDTVIATILRQLAKDETFHYAFYRDAVKAYLDLNPNYAWPLARVVIEFQMPGATMPGYEDRMRLIAKEVGYGPAQYYRQVIATLVEYWNLPTINPTYSAAQEAIDDLKKHLRRLERISARLSVGDGSGYGIRREPAPALVTVQSHTNGSSTKTIDDEYTLNVMREAGRRDE